MGDFFVGAGIADGVFPAPTRTSETAPWSPDYRSVLQLHNPSTSGVNLVVSSCNFTWMTFGYVDNNGVYQGYQKCQLAVGLDLRIHTSPLANFQRHGVKVDGDHGASKAEFRWEQILGINLPTSAKLFKEIWMGKARETREFVFAKPIVLVPGESIISSHDQPSIYNIGGFEWEEVAV